MILVGAGALSLALVSCQGGGVAPPTAAPQQPAGGTESTARMAPPMSLTIPKSVSPGLVHPAPMAQTAVLPASAMTSGARVSPMESIAGPGWSLIPGSGTQIAGSPDGTFWVLSGTGADKGIWHYIAGTWTNIPGQAADLAVAPNGTLYALNAEGGIYSWNGTTWSGFAGGASAITVATDGSIFVLSNGGSGNQAIWHYVSGVWTAVPGSGVALAASLDPNSYSTPGGTVSSGGIYVLNSAGNIYYRNSSGTYVGFPGAASGIAPTTTGGFFVMTFPLNVSTGSPLYYYNLSSPGWTAEPGSALSISTGGTKLYAISHENTLFSTSIAASSAQTAPGTALSGPLYGYDNNIAYGYGPTDFATKLQYPVQQGYDGTGQTVAIVISSATLATDISTYLSYYDTPTRSRTLSTVSVDGASGVNSGGQDEATLDEETIAGLAPGANVTIYQVPLLTDADIIDAYNKILSDGNAKIVSSSFSQCEYSGMTSMDTIFAEGAQAGVAFVASSGDQGNDCYDNGSYVFGPGFPANDPNVIGAGGTETYPLGAVDELLNPVVWNDTYFGEQLAGGGGVSASWRLPAYQEGLIGATSSTFRNDPDISLPAMYDSAVLNGEWTEFAGTSWSAPAFAALMAEVYEYCGTAIENPVTVPYYVYRTAGYSAFINVTSGTDEYNSTTPYYSGGTGFNTASGIGIPLGLPFAETACPNSQPAPTLQRPRTAMAYAALRAAAPLTLDVTPRVHGLADRGRRDPNAQTRIQIVLLRTASRASDEQTVIQALQNAGFTIVQTFSNHLVIDAQAPSATVERFFGTQMHDVAEENYGAHYLPATTVTVPASIASYTAGVTLDDVVAAFIPRGASLARARAR
jgi:hypothetical protein